MEASNLCDDADVTKKDLTTKHDTIILTADVERMALRNSRIGSHSCTEMPLDVEEIPVRMI
jgi:hypothetical protein